MPGAFLTASDDLPYADDWANTPGVRLKLLMADIEGAKIAVRIRFAPGILLPPHKHTGEVHAFTMSGEWTYLEYPDNPPSRAGSYLYEPPGSTHTLNESHLRDWPAALRAQGKPVPAALPIGGAMRYRGVAG